LNNCINFLKKPIINENLVPHIDKTFMDNMNDDYNNLVGAWPESYVFANEEGIALWKSTFDGKAIKELEEADQFFDAHFGIESEPKKSQET
jgi:hypothetical protein